MLIGLGMQFKYDYMVSLTNYSIYKQLFEYVHAI